MENQTLKKQRNFAILNDFWLYDSTSILSQPPLSLCLYISIILDAMT